MARDSKTGAPFIAPSYTLQQRPPESKIAYPNLGSLVLTKNRVFIGAGRKDTTSGFSHTSISIQESDELDDNMQPFERLRHGLTRLATFVPKMESLVVSSFGPFCSTDEDKIHGQSIQSGRFEDYKHLDHWRGFDLKSSVYDILNEFVKNRKIEEFPRAVSVEHDIDMSAIGEHYAYLDTLPKTLPNDNAREARFTTAYIKVSNTLNVGLVTNKELLRGRHQPQFNHIRPSHLINGRIDPFVERDDLNGGGFEALLTVSGIEKRAKKPWSQIPDNDPCWDYVSYYLAELCCHLILSVSPKRISLGGKVLKGSSNYEAGWKRLIDKTRLFVNARLSGLTYGPPISLYEDLHDLDSFVDYRIAKSPALFGGLIVANRQLERSYSGTS